MTAGAHRPLAIVNARIVDPASGLDSRGAVRVRDGVIEDRITGSDPGP
ncbi:MAG: hypothetical protein RL588_1564, partial [Pseudomonadota bacterium]